MTGNSASKTLICGEADFLPEDVHGFFGNEIGIRSNSHEVLEHLRLMYGRFYLGCAGDLKDSKGDRGNNSRLVIVVIDNLASSNELLLTDSFYLYRLSKNDNHFNVTSRDLHTLKHDSLRVCDHLTFIQGALLRTISRMARNYQFIHAGAVSRGNRGIIFPGLTGMGKTTLVLKLVSHGFGFLSDEVACINPDLDILEPFPRRVNIRQGSRSLLGLTMKPDTKVTSFGTEWEWTLDIEDIVPCSLSDQCKPRYILFLKGFGEEPRLEPVSGSDALFELFKFSFSPMEDPAFLLFKFAPLFNEIRCFNLIMGDLDKTAELFMELFDERKGDN